MSEVANAINKKVGRQVCFMGSNRAVFAIHRRSTGIIGMDIAFGGGIPNGFVQVWGPESTGKTTTVIHHIATCQKADPEYKAAYVDVEHEFDLDWAEIIGVDVSRLTLVQPATAEEALDIVEDLIYRRFDTIVVDSVAALCAKAEYVKTHEEKQMGALPSILSKFFRKGTAAMSPITEDYVVKTKGKKEKKMQRMIINTSTIIFINQVREKFSSYGGGAEIYSGGRALRHHLRVSLKIKKGDPIKGSFDSGLVGDLMDISAKKSKSDAEEAVPVVGHYLQMLTDKNKTFVKTPVMRTILYTADSSEGSEGEFDHITDITRFALMFGFVIRNKQIYHYGKMKFVGFKKWKAWLQDHIDAYYRLYGKIIKKVVGENHYGQIQTALFTSACQSETGKGNSEGTRGRFGIR